MFTDALLSFKEISSQLIREKLSGHRQVSRVRFSHYQLNVQLRKCHKEVFPGGCIVEIVVIGSILIIRCCLIIIPTFSSLKQHIILQFL